jgi:hypothetical protein
MRKPEALTLHEEGWSDVTLMKMVGKIQYSILA